MACRCKSRVGIAPVRRSSTGPAETSDYRVFVSPDPSVDRALRREPAADDGGADLLGYQFWCCRSRFYLVRGADCFVEKICGSADDCFAGEGDCIAGGPFTVPGRSLSGSEITVSSASLTSSVITFFSPRTEVFRVSSTAEPGRTVETFTNLGNEPTEIESEAFPPGCCPVDPEVPEQLRCGEECVDYLNDPQNCGECGNVCGDDQCCSGGTCVSVCPDGQVLCDGECVDLNSDDFNCGACGEACPDNACCDGNGQCAALCDAGETLCFEEDVCSNLDSDPANCGACGNACESDECCEGGECTKRCDDPLTLCPDDECYDLRFDENNCGACGRECDERKERCIFGLCIDVSRVGEVQGDPGDAVSKQAITCDGATSPSDPFCPNENPTGPTPPSCPEFGNEPPQPPTPNCEAPPVVTVIPPGETVELCTPAGVLFREVSTRLVVCGQGIPGPDGQCGDGVAAVASGTFNRFVPDTQTEVGDAFLTPFGVKVLFDGTRDFLLGPGEEVRIEVELLNAGPVDIDGATATLLAPPVDLTDDGVANPVAFDLTVETVEFGTIPGTTPATCDGPPPTLNPAKSLLPFEFVVPEDHPGDTSHPVTLRVTGTVDGEPFEQDVKFNLGVSDRCDIANDARDFDVVDGLRPPMARLVPPGNEIRFAPAPFQQGETIPLRLAHFCGLTPLTDQNVDAPTIAGLSEETLGELDVQTLDLDNDRAPGDLTFTWDELFKRWVFNLKTTGLEPGTYTIEIRLADRKNYRTGFVLQ